MTQDPQRWLDGGSADPALDAWMQLGADELAPPDVLARISARLSAAALEAPAPPPKDALPRRGGAVGALKWFGPLLLATAVVYLLQKERAPTRAPSSSTVTAPAIASPPTLATQPLPAPVSSMPTHARAPDPPVPPAPVPTSAPSRGAPHKNARALEPTSTASTSVVKQRPGAAQSGVNAEPGVATDAPDAVPTRGSSPFSGPGAAPSDPRGDSPTPATVTRPYPARPKLRATEASPAPGTQREELAQLEAAQRALREDPAAALAAMQRHARTYPRSWLAEERDAMIVRAYLALRDLAHARAALAQFTKRYPESPQSRQLARDLESSTLR